MPNDAHVGTAALGCPAGRSPVGFAVTVRLSRATFVPLAGRDHDDKIAELRSAGQPRAAAPT